MAAIFKVCKIGFKLHEIIIKFPPYKVFIESILEEIEIVIRPDGGIV